MNEEPDSETIDYLDPENADIEIERETPIIESPVNLETDMTDLSEDTEEVNENAFSTQESLILPDNPEPVQKEEPKEETKAVDDFLILDFDNDIDVKDKVIPEDEELNYEDVGLISDIIADDINKTELHVEEEDLPKAKEEDDVADEPKVNKKVETDLDKLFKNGLSDESEEFSDENEEEFDIKEELPSEIEQEEEIPDEVNIEIPNSSVESASSFPELDELNNILREEAEVRPKGKRKVKRIIVLTVGTAFIVSAITAGVTAFLFNNVDVERFDENPANRVQVKEIPLNPEPMKQTDMPLEGLKSLDLSKDTEKEFYVLPPSTTELEPNGFDIKNIDVSWDIPEICVDTQEKKNNLLNLGRKIKLALSNDLLLIDEKPTQKNVIINMIVKDKVLKAGSIQATSGSKVIDKLVIQTVNDVLKNSKLTLEGLNNETGYPSLIISF